MKQESVGTRRKWPRIQGKHWTVDGERLALRRVRVPGAGTFEVPRYIRRLEGEKARGWQVAYRGMTKLFSDSRHKGPPVVACGRKALPARGVSWAAAPYPVFVP